MKMKTCSLTGKHLNYAVAMCEGYSNARFNSQECKERHLLLDDSTGYTRLLIELDYENNGTLVSNIVEKYGICVRKVKAIKSWHWEAGLKLPSVSPQYGENHRVAVLRCLVYNKIGNEVEIPDALIK